MRTFVGSQTVSVVRELGTHLSGRADDVLAYLLHVQLAGNSHAVGVFSGCLSRPSRLQAVNGQFVVPAGGQVKVPTPRGLISWLLIWCLLGCSGLFHAVGVAVGDDDVAVVQEPVEQADGGGVFGQEPAPGLEGPVRVRCRGSGVRRRRRRTGTAVGRRCRPAGRSRVRRR